MVFTDNANMICMVSWHKYKDKKVAIGSWEKFIALIQIDYNKIVYCT